MSDQPADVGADEDIDHEAQETDAKPEPLSPAEMADFDRGDDKTDEG